MSYFNLKYRKTKIRLLKIVMKAVKVSKTTRVLVMLILDNNYKLVRQIAVLIRILTKIMMMIQKLNLERIAKKVKKVKSQKLRKVIVLLAAVKMTCRSLDLKRFKINTQMNPHQTVNKDKTRRPKRKVKSQLVRRKSQHQ